MARPSLFLLLLCAPAALGQSAEPSPYDSNVADYSCTACPVYNGSDPCPVTVEQTGPKAATATISNAAGAVAAYLTDATGTVIAYTSSPSTSISFDFSETDAWADYSYPGSPSGLIAHVVFASTCSSSAMVSTWDAILDNYMSSDESTFGADGTMTSGGSAPTATVASANVLTGGSYSVTFPKAATSVLAWIRDSTGTLLFVKDMTGDDADAVRAAFSGTVSSTFPAGTTSLEYCEATDVAVSCATTSIVPDYIASLEAGTTTNALKTTIQNKDATQNKDGTYVIAPDTAALGGVACETYSIYVKKTSGASTALAFAFTSAVEVIDTYPPSFYTYLQCGSSLTVYWSEVTADDVVAWSGLSIEQEVMVGHPACDNADGNDIPDGTNVTLDGRDCRCDKGNLFCDAKGTGSYFRLSNDEAVGIALSVSVIVILLLLAAIFFCLKKTAQNQELKTVLATNTKADDRL